MRPWVRMTFLMSLGACAQSHSPSDDVADDASGDADADTDADTDGDGDADVDDCRPHLADCPPNEPREGSTCDLLTEGQCFYLSEGCERTYLCEECVWTVTRRLGC